MLLQMLQVAQGKLYNKMRFPVVDTIHMMKTLIHEKLKYYFKELKDTVVVEGIGCTEAVCLDTKDELVNLGAGFFGCSLYPILMSSGKEIDDTA